MAYEQTKAFCAFFKGLLGKIAIVCRSTPTRPAKPLLIVIIDHSGDIGPTVSLITA